MKIVESRQPPEDSGPESTTGSSVGRSIAGAFMRGLKGTLRAVNKLQHPEIGIIEEEFEAARVELSMSKAEVSFGSFDTIMIFKGRDGFIQFRYDGRDQLLVTQIGTYRDGQVPDREAATVDGEYVPVFELRDLMQVRGAISDNSDRVEYERPHKGDELRAVIQEIAEFVSKDEVARRIFLEGDESVFPELERRRLARHGNPVTGRGEERFPKDLER